MNRKLKKGPLIILIVLVCAVLFFVVRAVTKKPAEENIEPENTAEPTPAETAEPAETEPTETPEEKTEDEDSGNTQSMPVEDNAVIEIEEESGYTIE